MPTVLEPPTTLATTNPPTPNPPGSKSIISTLILRDCFFHYPLDPDEQGSGSNAGVVAGAIVIVLLVIVVAIVAALAIVCLW